MRAMNLIESGVVQFYEPCGGGCGEPVLGGALCRECVALAKHYDAKEHRVKADASTTRRGVFTFLGWNGAGPASAVRLAAESETATACADSQRRSALMAKLPRERAAVREECGLSRYELWQTDVPLATVLAVVAWDAVRTAWWSSLEFAARRLRGRLGVTGFVVGSGLALAASLLAWRLR